MKKLGAGAFVVSAVLLTGSAGPCGAQGLDSPEGPSLAKTLETKPLSWDGPRDDGRRTMGAFPKNLGRNFVGVFSGQNLVPVRDRRRGHHHGLGVRLRMRRAFSRAPARPAGRREPPREGAPWCRSSGRCSWPDASPPRAASARPRTTSPRPMIVTGAYTSILKYSVQRTRPDGSNSLSFPSGHTSTAFSLAAVANRHYGWKVGVPAYVLASGIGLSRIESNSHHLSDVLGGGDARRHRRADGRRGSTASGRRSSARSAWARRPTSTARASASASRRAGSRSAHQPGFLPSSAFTRSTSGPGKRHSRTVRRLVSGCAAKKPRTART